MLKAETSPSARRTVPAASRLMLAMGALVLLAGCETNRDSVIVGSIPDDYRTNHPIMIGDKEHVLDLPVGGAERGMTGMQKARLDGFLGEYDRSANPVLTITAPVGGYNEVAASYAARDFAHRAKMLGIPPERIAVTSYQSASAEAAPPVRVIFTMVRAYTDRCGRWPEDITNTPDNKHYADFGCSTQNNLAAQVANPTDLLGPRRRGEIDAENRRNVIADYRALGNGTFRGGSQVSY